MNKAVFYDRDGIVNFEVGDYITRVEDFKLLPSFISFLKQMQEAGYLAVIITNQAGIAKGRYNSDTLKQMHAKLEIELKTENLKVDAIYYCPHHDEYGKCLCRKPHSLLVEKALARFQIDPKQSFMIGDKLRDKQCAEAAGVKGYVIHPNPELEDLMNIYQSFLYDKA
ncbi:MAG: D-glycero-alpha-D-manno-heptose-1,7-bisphosphate 7-phosphatase [Flavobacteriales bacterium]